MSTISNNIKDNLKNVNGIQHIIVGEINIDINKDHSTLIFQYKLNIDIDNENKHI